MHAGCPVLVGSKWGRYNKCTEQKSKMFVSHAMDVGFLLYLQCATSGSTREVKSSDDPADCPLTTSHHS